MGFFSTLFGGPSQQQKTLSGQAANLAGTMNQAFNQRLDLQNSIYSNLNRQLTPIANLGPGQRGGSPEQWAAQNTLAVNNAAAAARNARQSVSSQLAGQGGGSGSGLTSGIQQQIQGTLASNAENQLSSATEENLSHQYDVGNQNFWKATGGEMTLGGAQDALQFGQGASETGQTALKDENQIQSMKQSMLGNIVGLGGSIIGGALTGGLSDGLTGALKGGLGGGMKTLGGTDPFASTPASNWGAGSWGANAGMHTLGSTDEQ